MVEGVQIAKSASDSKDRTGNSWKRRLQDTERFEPGPVSSAWSKTKAKVVSTASTASTASTELEMLLLVGGCAWQMHCA